MELGNGWRDQAPFPVKDPSDVAGYDSLPKVLRAQLVVQLTNGSSAVLSHTGDGLWTDAAGPVVADSVYNGEQYDGRVHREQQHWDLPVFDGALWSAAQKSTSPPQVLYAAAVLWCAAAAARWCCSGVLPLQDGAAVVWCDGSVFQGLMVAWNAPAVTIAQVRKPVKIWQPKQQPGDSNHLEHPAQHPASTPCLQLHPAHNACCCGLLLIKCLNAQARILCLRYLCCGFRGELGWCVSDFWHRRCIWPGFAAESW